MPNFKGSFNSPFFKSVSNKQGKRRLKPLYQTGGKQLVLNELTVKPNADTSDYRCKSLIKPLSLEEFSIDNIKPVSFVYTESGKESLGVIAHELQEYFPFLVNGEKDGDVLQTVNYIPLIAVLIKEIQELKNKIK